MDDQTREKYLEMALVVFGVVFLLVYPLGVIWPSGWIWHGGQGNYYLQMICGIYAVLGYPLLPEGVRGWFETLIVAKEAGVSFEEVRDRLEGTEEDEAFREWSAAVTASVMGYSSLPSKRTMN